MASRQPRRCVRLRFIATALAPLESPTGRLWLSKEATSVFRVSAEPILVVDSSREFGNRPLPNWHTASWLHWVNFPMRLSTYYRAASVPDFGTMRAGGKCRHRQDFHLRSLCTSSRVRSDVDLDSIVRGPVHAPIR